MKSLDTPRVSLRHRVASRSRAAQCFQISAMALALVASGCDLESVPEEAEPEFRDTQLGSSIAAFCGKYAGATVNIRTANRIDGEQQYVVADALAPTDVRTPVFAFNAAEIEVDHAQRRAQWRAVCEDGMMGFSNLEFHTWLSVGEGNDENVYQTRYGVPAGKQLPQEAGSRWSPFNNSQLEKWILRADLDQKFMWADDQDVEVAADPGCRSHVFEVVTTAVTANG